VRTYRSLLELVVVRQRHEDAVGSPFGKTAGQQNLVYYSRLLKAHPQTPTGGKATCCAKHAGLDAPV
jgi:hypothetical protein